MNQPSFKLAEDRKSVLMEIDPSLPAPDPDTAKKAFEASDYRGYCLMEDAVAAVLERVCTGEQSQSVTAVVAQRRDAELAIEIAPDGLAATATITAAFQGRHVTTMDLAVATRTQGVTSGLIMHNFADLVRRAKAAAPGERISEIIAEGKAPVAGEDARLEQLTETLKDRVLKPRGRADGSVDMRDLGEVVTVDAGSPLLRRHPPRPGEDGIAVSGERIPHRPGNDRVLAVGEGSGISPDDPDLLVATRSGVPRRVEDTLNVEPSLVLDRVDLSTGNIEFEGCVLVKGDVAEDMRMQVSGDVDIGGVVESAVIEAGGDLLVRDGVIGHQVDPRRSADAELSARLQAGGDLVAKYAQNAELRSGGSVRIAKYLFHSQVTARYEIRVGGERRADGRLVGGRLSAGQGVQAGSIGAEVGTKTHIDLSTRAAVVKGEVDTLKATLKSAVAEHNGLVEQLRRLKRTGPPNSPQCRQIADTLRECRDRFEADKAALAAWEAELEALLPQLAVLATRKLHPGTRVSLLDERFNASREHGPSRVRILDGELQAEPWSG